MCRLFAIHSSQPVGVRQAFAALKVQSFEHKDGWGIARFPNSGVEVERGLEPAHASARFDRLGESLQERTLLAHIRLASVGGVVACNTHPFSGSGWAFSHNGTLNQFSRCRAALEQMIAPDLLAAVQGDTDSERCFALFLTHLRDTGATTPRAMARALALTIHAARACVDAGAEKPSSVNVLASNGETLIAARAGKSLVRLRQPEGWVVASEPMWADAIWQSIPEASVSVYDSALQAHDFQIADLLA